MIISTILNTLEKFSIFMDYGELACVLIKVFKTVFKYSASFVCCQLYRKDHLGYGCLTIRMVQNILDLIVFSVFWSSHTTAPQT